MNAAPHPLSEPRASASGQTWQATFCNSVLVRISHRSGADVAQAVQPAVSRVVSTLVDARGGLPRLETSPRMATRQAGQPAPRSGLSGCEKSGIRGDHAGQKPGGSLERLTPPE